MPRLGQRIDTKSVTATFLRLPKGKKRGYAVGFCGEDPVACVEVGNAAPPFRWVVGKPEPLAFQDIKKISASGTSPSQVAGLWYSPKGDERAVVWTRQDEGGMRGVELHPPKWDKSNALACGGGQQVGYGYVKFVKEPTRALLWCGTPESLVCSPDPIRLAMPTPRESRRVSSSATSAAPAASAPACGAARARATSISIPPRPS
jgi:hypothetical protein